MNTRVKIAGIEKESIVDGPGFRMTVFFQGCPHRCPGCHNPQTQGDNGGEFMETNTILSFLKTNPMLSGITLSGGEPLFQPQPASEIAKAVTAMGKNVIVYTGHTWEEVQEMMQKDPHVTELIENTFLLIDGRFIESLRSLNLSFRGSANQRIIDVQKTLQNNREIIIYDI